MTDHPPVDISAILHAQREIVRLAQDEGRSLNSGEVMHFRMLDMALKREREREKVAQAAHSVEADR